MALEPRNLVVKKRITDLIEAINPTETDPATDAAYEIDLRGCVFRGRSVIGDETPRPFIAILEAPKNEPGFRGGDERVALHGDREYLIQGFATNTAPHETDGCDLLAAQVAQRLSRISEVISAEGMNRGKGKYPEYRLGGLVSGVEIGEPIVRPADKQVSNTAYFYIVLRVKSGTNPVNPYVST